MTDVQDLAGELGVSSVVIRQAVTEITGAPAGDSTLAPELASQVRERLRGTQRGVPGPIGSPMFSAPTVRPTASRPDSRDIAPVFAVREGERRPAQQARGHGDDAAATRFAAPAPTARPAEERVRPTSEESAQEYGAALSSQLAAQSAHNALTEQWRAAGLGIHDGHLIEQCLRNGLTPDDLRRRVDGQTVASRLKNGESISSVRSRMS